MSISLATGSSFVCSGGATFSRAAGTGCALRTCIFLTSCYLDYTAATLVIVLATSPVV